FRDREYDPCNRAGRDRERDDRDRDRGRARSVEEIDLNGNRIEQMRQRQPHGADLLPSGRDAVEDSSRDNEMSARVVVRERETESMVVPRGDGTAGRRRDANRHRKRGRAPSAGQYNHSFILWANSSADSDRSRWRSAAPGSSSSPSSTRRF